MPTKNQAAVGDNLALALRADAFVLSFDGVVTFYPGEAPQFDGSVSLKSTIPEAKHLFRARAAFPLHELEELGTTLETHKAKLPVGPLDLEAVLREQEMPRSIWFPLDLSVKVECGEGETAWEGGLLAGEFEFQVFVSVADPKSERRLYGGLESSLDVREADSFARAVRERIGQLMSRQPSIPLNPPSPSSAGLA